MRFTQEVRLGDIVVVIIYIPDFYIQFLFFVRVVFESDGFFKDRVQLVVNALCSTKLNMYNFSTFDPKYILLSMLELPSHPQFKKF